MFKRFAIFVAAVLVLAGCAIPRFNFNIVRGSGQMTSRDYAIAGFDALDVRNAFDVTVKQGEPFQVSVTTDDNIFPYVVVEKVGRTLVIRLDPQQRTSFNATRAEAAITLPALLGVRASGASRIRLPVITMQTPFDADLSGASMLTGWIDAPSIHIQASGASQAQLTAMTATASIDADLSGASKLTGGLHVPNAQVRATGASTAMLTGEISEASFDLSGASRCDCRNLATNSASVFLSGASSVTLHPTSLLDYRLSGGSTLRYAGQPAIGAHETSGGSSALALP